MDAEKVVDAVARLIAQAKNDGHDPTSVVLSNACYVTLRDHGYPFHGADAAREAIFGLPIRVDADLPIDAVALDFDRG